MRGFKVLGCKHPFIPWTSMVISPIEGYWSLDCRQLAIQPFAISYYFFSGIATQLFVSVRLTVYYIVYYIKLK